MSIALLDLSANSQELLDTGKIFEGQLSLHGCVLRNVSAHSLKSLVAPLSLKHHSKMDSEDKLIWDANYDEEYAGLVFFPTWNVITEGQFHCLSKGKEIPGLAILGLLHHPGPNKDVRFTLSRPKG